MKNSALVLFILIFSNPVYSDLLDITDIGFEEFDSDDIDFFLATFNRLTSAVEDFIGEKTLEQSIDQWGAEFKEGLNCAAKTVATVGGIELGKNFPDLEMFHNEAANECKDVTTTPYGKGSVSEQFIYRDCTLAMDVDLKYWDYKIIKAGYFGLKDIAETEFCMAGENTAGIVFKQAKHDLGYSHIRARVWSEISEMNGCDTTVNMHLCVQRYVESNADKLSQFKKVNRPKEPEVLRLAASRLDDWKDNFWENLFRTEGVPKEIFKAYESIATQSLRVIDVAKLNRLRRTKFEKEYNTIKDGVASIKFPQCPTLFTNNIIAGMPEMNVKGKLIWVAVLFPAALKSLDQWAEKNNNLNSEPYYMKYIDHQKGMLLNKTIDSLRTEFLSKYYRCVKSAPVVSNYPKY